MSNIIQDLNKKHAVIRWGGKFFIMNKEHDPITGHPDITFSSVQDFKHWYGNKFVKVGETSIPIAKHWLESPERQQHEGIVFDPTKKANGYYNLYQGLAIIPKEGDWGMMQEHIYKYICRGNEWNFEWFLAWLAHPVQDPGGERPGTSVVLRGAQGAGKGCVVSNYGKIFGPHFRHITNQKHLAGNFNNHLKDAIVVFVDEGFWAGDKAVEGVLKGLITEDIVMLEAKGKDAIPIKNHMRFIMASNNDWVVPAGLNERRFAVFDVDSNRAGDRKYFDELFRLMDNGGREAMLYDLLHLDIIIDLRTIPRTDALLEQIINTVDSVQAWWVDCLYNGSIALDDDIWPLEGTRKEIYAEYIEYCTKRNIRHKESQITFGKKLMHFCNKISVGRMSGGSRPWAYRFPSLRDCRHDFEEKTNMKIDWGLEQDV